MLSDIRSEKRTQAVNGNYAYIADGEAGLRVHVSDPANPNEVGFYDTGGFALGVAVNGDYAYVADGDSGLRVIDVSNPPSPMEVGFYDTPGSARGVAVSGIYVYVGADQAGLRVIDVSDPTNPNEVGFFDTDSQSSRVAVGGSVVYMADGDDGLYIIRNDLITSVKEKSAIPLSFSLSQNYPNPFNPTTTIQYTVSAEAFVTLRIYNILGQVVAPLVSEEREAGSYQVQFDGTGLASGVYFYRLQAGDPSAGSGHSFVDTKKLLLLK